ncbi:MAG: hypothetical protein A2270_09475 [Elusimicrobia bacterium RIFOXYA12_FULL_51_18]|nr:MAG: hypothetical protein A2270_09475 [Elusimicrobia bacterium RIFOXYA12_FULL_51_18]OGS32731.1 MAG: hypothetical protein A2218_11790 [Elusimicrobia bacterium RIFOXYA2_FULL_53_38]
MAIEKGIRLGTMTLADLKKSGGLEAAMRGFTRFYLGPEFCENLLDGSVCAEIAWLQGQGKKICLLTPLLSEKGARLLNSLFKRLLKLVKGGKIDPAGLEITVNDFGAIELAKRNRLPFKLNAGRLLRNNVFDDAVDGFKVHNGRVLEFFSKLGITRYELSTIGIFPKVNFASGRFYGFNRRTFKITLYYPYLDLTNTRTCLVGMRDVPPEGSALGVTCARECLISSFEITHPSIREKLLVRGNTIFLEFPDKFYASEKDLLTINVDRLVYAPFP